MCVFLCVYVCAYVCIMLVEIRGQHCMSSSIALHHDFWNRVSHWIWSSFIHSARLAFHITSGLLLSALIQHCNHRCSRPFYLCSIDGPYSVDDAYVLSTLPTEPVSPHIFIKMKHWCSDKYPLSIIASFYFPQILYVVANYFSRNVLFIYK